MVSLKNIIIIIEHVNIQEVLIAFQLKHQFQLGTCGNIHKCLKVVNYDFGVQVLFWLGQ